MPSGELDERRVPTMTSMRGADLAEMQNMAQAFGREAGHLQEIIQRLNSERAKIGSVWTGPGAQRFGESWDTARGSFTKMVQALHEAEQAIRTYQRNIESATQ